jgi:hypothetical protein
MWPSPTPIWLTCVGNGWGGCRVANDAGHRWLQRSWAVATHLLEDVALVADRWFALDSGRLVANGEVDRSSPEGATASTELIRSVIADRQSTA